MRVRRAVDPSRMSCEIGIGDKRQAYNSLDLGPNIGSLTDLGYNLSPQFSEFFLPYGIGRDIRAEFCRFDLRKNLRFNGLRVELVLGSVSEAPA